MKKPPEGLGPEALKRFEEDAASNAATEDLPENKELRPLLPFLAMVTYDIIDNYYETVSGPAAAHSRGLKMAFWIYLE